MDSSRGVLFPGRDHELHRVPPPNVARDLAVWFWVAEWDLPVGEVSRQHLLAFPASNLAVEPDLVGFAGPPTRASHRDLRDRGWAVAALLQPAAIPTFTDDPSHDRDAYRGLDEPELHRAVTEAMEAGWQTAVTVLAEWLANRVGDVGEEALLANRMADLVARDPDVRTVDDIADALAVSPSTVHRLAARYVGLTPYAMIRRRRLQEAAEWVRKHPDALLSDIAADLGYSDPAHLTRDFRSMLGFSPGAYRRESREG